MSELGSVSAWVSCFPAWGFTGSAFTVHVHISRVQSSSDHLNLHPPLVALPVGWFVSAFHVPLPRTFCLGGREEQHLSLQAQMPEDCATRGQAQSLQGKSPKCDEASRGHNRSQSSMPTT